MKKLLQLSCVIAIIIPLALLAQNGNEQHHHKPNPEIGKYIREQIMPVLVKKRQQFDAELSAAEKKEIEECKAALKQLGPPPHHGFGKPDDNQQAGQNNTLNNEPPAKDQYFEQHHAIMQKLEAIAAKHSNSLDEIRKQLEPQRQQWIADIKKLEAAGNNNAAPKENEPSHGPGFPHHMGPEMLIYGHHTDVHFLLLPVSIEELNQMPEPGAEGMPNGTLTNTAPLVTADAIKLDKIQVLPNPASNDLQLGNDVLPAVNQLKIFDLNGKEVLSAENVQAAQHFDISQLPSGTYLVQVKSGDQVVNQKIVVSK